MCVCVCFFWDFIKGKMKPWFFSVTCIVLRVKQWLFWYRNHACTTTASETRAARRSATMLSSCFNRRPPFSHNLPRHRRVWRAGIFKDNCQLVVCYCVSSDHAYRNSMELFIPIVHAVRHNPAVSRNILTKWQPPIWLGYRKAGVLHAASNSAYSRCTSMILYQINCF